MLHYLIFVHVYDCNSSAKSTWYLKKYMYISIECSIIRKPNYLIHYMINMILKFTKHLNIINLCYWKQNFAH